MADTIDTRAKENPMNLDLARLMAALPEREADPEIVRKLGKPDAGLGEWPLPGGLVFRRRTRRSTLSPGTYGRPLGVAVTSRAAVIVVVRTSTVRLSQRALPSSRFARTVARCLPPVV